MKKTLLFALALIAVGSVHADTQARQNLGDEGEMMNEFVYLLINPSIPDLVTIGRTKNLEQRMRSLSSHSSVPAHPVASACAYRPVHGC